MARRWRWIDRAQAFDRWTQQQHALEIEQVRRTRLEQLLSLDRDVHYPRIIALNKKIDEAVASGLAKTVKTEGGMTHSLDRADGFQKMCDELARLEDEYFGPAREILNQPEDGRKRDDEDQPVTVIGRFEYIPDPEVPDPPPTDWPQFTGGGAE